MRYTWRNLRNLTYWRPQFWKDIKFNQHLWKRVYEGYATLLKEERSLAFLIVNHGYDEFTTESAFKTLSRVENAWGRLVVAGYSFQNIEFKSLQLTPKETMIYMEYRQAAYTVFYKCCEMLFTAQVTAGQITMSKREEGMEKIREQECLKGF